MESLPIEILAKIFSFLEVPEFLKVAEVCTTFEATINSSLFLARLRVDLTCSEDFEDSARNYVNVKIENLQDEIIRKFNKTSKSLRKFSCSVKSLKLIEVETSSPNVVKSLIMNFGNVKELHLEGVYIKNPQIEPIKLEKLKVLTFLYSSNELLKVFTEVKSQLRIFKLCLVPHDNEDTKHQSYQLVNDILQNNSCNLEKLNFYDVNFDDHFLDKISELEFPKLAKFSMSFNSYLSPESHGFEKFVDKNVNNLKKFKIRTFDHIQQRHLQTLIDKSINLKSLNLIVCSFCDFHTFSGFENLKLLETLKLQPTSHCSAGNTSYQKFIENKILNYQNNSMRNLTIKSLETISDHLLEKIVLSFPNLLSLKISAGSNESSNNFKFLKSKLESIRKIVVNDVTHDEAVFPRNQQSEGSS